MQGLDPDQDYIFPTPTPRLLHVSGYYINHCQFQVHQDDPDSVKFSSYSHVCCPESVHLATPFCNSRQSTGGEKLYCVLWRISTHFCFLSLSVVMCLLINSYGCMQIDSFLVIRTQFQRMSLGIMCLVG